MLLQIFYAFLYMSAALTLTGALAILSEKLFSRFLSRNTLYVLFTLPLVLALFSFAFPSPRSASPVFSSQEALVEKDAAEIAFGEKTAPAGGDAASPAILQKSEAAPALKKAAEKSSVNFPKLFSAIWLFGVVFFALSRLVHFFKFRRNFYRFAVKSGKSVPKETAFRVGIKREIPIYSFDFDASPFVYGLLRPKIAAPRGEISPEALLHELIHIKRRDLAVLNLLGVVKTLHFFNPFAYFYSERVKRAMEFSCDETASSLMDFSERAAYSKSLILCSAPVSARGACLSENGKYLKERIELIMKNKKRGVLTKAASLVISLIMVFSQAAVAAAVGGRAPNSLSTLTASYIGGASFYDTDMTYSSVSVSATLTDTPLKKSFSADAVMYSQDKTDGIIVSSGEEKNENDATHLLHVEMSSLTKIFASGRNWQGKFTVTLDGNTVMDNADGVLHSLPGEYFSDRAALLVKDGERSLLISGMDFSLASDSVINWEAEIERYKSFAPTFSHAFTDGEKLISEISANEAEGLLNLDRISWNDFQISSVPGEKYEFSNDTAKGKFYIYDSFVIVDEFYGTLSYSDTSLSLKSDDGKIDVSYENLKDSDWASIKISDSVTLSDLPFTLALSPDKKSVVLNVSDSLTDPWFYTYSSYVREPYNVCSDYVSERGARRTLLPLSEAKFGVHNLQFTRYRTRPSLYKESYDIMFKIVDGELFFTGCHKYTDEDESLSGDAAQEYMNENSMLMTAKKYYYDENGIFKYTVE